MAVTPDHPGMTLPRAELGVLPTPFMRLRSWRRHSAFAAGYC